MIYLIGGAPRVGKTTLTQRIVAQMGIGWVSTDALMTLLRAKEVEGVPNEWNADPEAIIATADWFFPCLEQFIWSVSSLAEHYIIEGVNFLPTHVKTLSEKYPVRTVFLGCANLTLERFDQFPGHSKGYAQLPEKMRRRIVHDVPLWSNFIQKEAIAFNYPYIDTSDNFSQRLNEAETTLTSSRV